MAPFLIVVGLMLIGTIAGVVYVLKNLHKTYIVQKIAKKNHWLGLFAAMIPLILLVIYAYIDVVNAVVVALNVIVIYILGQIIWNIIKKLIKSDTKRNFGALAAIVFSIIYLSVGWYLAHHVVVTEYYLTTAKDIGAESVRVVQVSDSHIGATFDGEGFAEHMKTVQELKPDVVVITGDYVDDGTTKEDMIIASEALGRLETTWGVYYIDGNHDRGYFQTRDFSYEEMLEKLEAEGVIILKDDVTLINDSFYIVGRADRTDLERADMETLTKDLDKSKYMLVLDHQPHDFNAQAAAKVDLVLCGHTHGGQMFPVGWLGEVTGANDKTYGLEVRDETTFIVNSGISDWAIKYKTATKAEIGLIVVTME
ncbi:MAG: metallophosphoesterase [Lachnospiraceae bacterium]|nr:metallophosphoesterase [Lachnospiraceae bacterium]